VPRSLSLFLSLAPRRALPMRSENFDFFRALHRALSLSLSRSRKGVRSVVLRVHQLRPYCP
jgi:hypothetical protein